MLALPGLSGLKPSFFPVRVLKSRREWGIGEAQRADDDSY
jgi:hypothetical protein